VLLQKKLQHLSERATTAEEARDMVWLLLALTTISVFKLASNWSLNCSACSPAIWKPNTSRGSGPKRTLSRNFELNIVTGDKS
jgi:hypothetical protein